MTKPPTDEASNYRKPYPKEKDLPMPKKPEPVNEGYAVIAVTLSVIAFFIGCFLLYSVVEHGNKGSLAVLLAMLLPICIGLFMLLQVQWRGVKK